MYNDPWTKWCDCSFDDHLIVVFLSHFVAPEILNGEKYTHAVDWWSLGIVMFTLLSGKVTVNTSVKLEWTPFQRVFLCDSVL